MKKNLLIIGGGRLLGYYLKKEFNYSEYNIYFFNRGISKINNLNYIKLYNREYKFWK